MAFDYKKEYKEFYLPKNKPQFIDLPPMNFIAVRGEGNPNEEDGAYKRAIGLLYSVGFTIKMSKLTDHRIDGYFDFVMPPLEGLWWQEGTEQLDLSHKERFQWISMIRLPDFVTKQAFEWAIDEATEKKKTDFSAVQYLSYNEGKCVQCMHIGPYDSEAGTIAAMERFMAENGWESDLDRGRYHHEIYLNDARRCKPERLKTVIRIPVRKK